MIILDAVVAFLLFASIIFSWRLNKSINRLKESKKEIATSVIEFSAALTNAEESIKKLKSLNAEVRRDLEENINKARFLANDLSFLIQKGNEVSDKLEGNVELTNNWKAAEKSAIGVSIGQANKSTHNIPTGKRGEFDNRAAKIAEGQVSGIYNNIISTEDASYNTKGLARKYAMEQALEQLARRNLAKAKNIQAPGENIAKEIPGRSKQRRLFDALKWGRQLNG